MKFFMKSWKNAGKKKIIINFTVMKKIFLASTILIAFAACQNATTENNKPASKDSSNMQSTHTEGIDISKLNFASKIDTTCGMPITAGVQDTVTVDGKLYGFCAKECKESFLKTLSAKK